MDNYDIIGVLKTEAKLMMVLIFKKEAIGTREIGNLERVWVQNRSRVPPK